MELGFASAHRYTYVLDFDGKVAQTTNREYELGQPDPAYADSSRPCG